MTPHDFITTTTRKIELMLQSEYHALHVTVYAERIRAASAYWAARDK